MEQIQILTDGKAIKEQLYDKVLNTKKNVLEYIDIVRKNKEIISEEGMKSSYSYIEDCINEMSENIKPNTVLYLKNDLKSKLGKYTGYNEKEQIDYFIEFFKEAYPDGKRRKSYTWVLADPSKITDEQILDTLKYINGWCLKGNKLSRDQKKDILGRIETIVYKGNLKYINQIRSMEGINKRIKFKIIKIKNDYIIEL